mmetsp:Transcript_36058/g.92906  ORF Transcript_36058/g.92906 Transcript_36058/m.92906 type:complete len:225 (+) Transcript_36058:1327-2001(+)
MIGPRVIRLQDVVTGLHTIRRTALLVPFIHQPAVGDSLHKETASGRAVGDEDNLDAQVVTSFPFKYNLELHGRLLLPRRWLPRASRQRLQATTGSQRYRRHQAGHHWRRVRLHLLGAVPWKDRHAEGALREGGVGHARPAQGVAEACSHLLAGLRRLHGSRRRRCNLLSLFLLLFLLLLLCLGFLARRALLALLSQAFVQLCGCCCLVSVQLQQTTGWLHAGPA